MTDDCPAVAEEVRAYLHEALVGDGRAGVRLVLGLLDGGMPIDDIIVRLLGAAQREVGEGWLRNHWTVADEHLASGVTQKALDAVANSVDTPDDRGLVVVACAEGDWHSLPAQMFAELLRSHGFAVAFLGASTPVDHVADLISRHRPDALAVSCNLPLFFGGLTRLADAAHRLGTPVIAGGRALGAGPDRALRLGADAWAAGVDDAATVLHRWHDDRPATSLEPTPVAPALVQLDLMAPEIAAAALDVLAVTYPPVRAYHPEQLARTHEDLAFIVRFAASAGLVDEPAVLTEMLDWLRTVLANRGIPEVAVTEGLTALAPLIGRTDPRSGQLVLDAL